MRRNLIVAIVFIVAAVIAAPAVAGGGTTKSTPLNARFVSWQENDAIVHLFVYPDAGKYGTTATVEVGKPLLFGFEFAEFDIAEPITVSVDGAPAESVVSWYFNVESDFTGPAWAWDHDNDGRGDGDGDGIDDWPEGPYSFFRFPLAGFTTPGAHQVEFTLTLSGTPITEVVSFWVMP